MCNSKGNESVKHYLFWQRSMHFTVVCDHLINRNIYYAWVNETPINKQQQTWHLNIGRQFEREKCYFGDWFVDGHNDSFYLATKDTYFIFTSLWDGWKLFGGRQQFVCRKKPVRYVPFVCRLSVGVGVKASSYGGTVEGARPARAL